jgi:UDP-N-acetylmuramoyl-tripeptide--D-alanyl-D-alanine ligase
VASYNTEKTFPLSILNREGSEEILILEMGMSRPGDLRRLVEVAVPHLAVVTKVALAHAAHFPGGLAEIAAGKAEIFSHPHTEQILLDHGCLAFQEAMRIPLHKRVRTVSMDTPSAFYFLESLAGEWRWHERGALPGRFLFPFRSAAAAHNGLVAIAIAREMGMAWEEIVPRIPLFQWPEMRGEIVEIAGVTWINDAYNANPASMRSALESLPAPRGQGRKVAVLATMKELGSFSEAAHREVGEWARERIDLLFVLGQEARPLYEAFICSGKRAEFHLEHDSLIDSLSRNLRAGDIVLLKGSRSMQMEKVLHF